ncbi:MAG: NADH-quinone oxidoreductase subunit C, partial [Chloroflexi bacterium]|nr:NADH-quinone oxidoreductase subunit C [Chloroflexota bacterium]
KAAEAPKVEEKVEVKAEAPAKAAEAPKVEVKAEERLEEPSAPPKLEEIKAEIKAETERGKAVALEAVSEKAEVEVSEVQEEAVVVAEETVR